jgi:hypothetical protein
MISIHLLSTLLAALSLPAAPATAPALIPAFHAGIVLGGELTSTRLVTPASPHSAASRPPSASTSCSTRCR